MIIIIGLQEEGFTQDALAALRGCGKVFARSGYMAGYSRLKESGIPHETLDNLFAGAKDFDALALRICRRIKAAEKEFKTVAYVPGGSGFEDAAARLLMSGKKGAAKQGTEKTAQADKTDKSGKGKPDSVHVLPAAGALSALKQAPAASYTLIAYEDLLSEPYLEFNTNYPLIIDNIPDRMAMADVCLKLYRFYREDAEAYLAGQKIKLHEAASQNCFTAQTKGGKTVTAGAALMLPPQDFFDKKRYSFADLLRVVRRLRADDGCPWDKAQTHDSIRMNAIEEAYELAEAIDNKDFGAMCEEAGDVLLQAVFHANMAEEVGEFDAADVLSLLCGKLIFRHSHIFGKDKAEGADEALTMWEKNKSVEKGQDTAAKSVEGVAKSFPALMRAQKVQKRAAKAGFEFENDAQVYGKLQEEIEELKEAAASGNPDGIAEEAGDVLFAAVNAVRRAHADAEEALIRSTEKFVRRFTLTEDILRAKGKTFSGSTPEEMDAAYREAKEQLKIL